MPPTDPKLALRGPVGAVVLAAGAATRMGAPKAVLPLAGRPMVVGIIEALLAAGGFSPLIVVTGHQPDVITAALARYPVTFRHNGDYAAGEMLSSIRTGLDALAGDVAAILLVLADQPGVQPLTLQKLLGHWHTINTPLLVPTHEGRRGHPILLSACLFGEIRSLASTQTLRDVVHRHLCPAAQLPVDDPAILWDIDTPEDYRRAGGLEQFRRGRE
jgi:molybdenum cofactor cytidylyltransferase